MKNSKSILLTAVITAILFGAIVFNSCSKSNNNNATPTNLCANIACQNGGTCASGVCSCPTGYTGTLCQTLSTTSIEFDNKTYTPITITVNGSNSTIPVGGSQTYTGAYNSTLSYTAYTYMTTASSTQIGLEMTWNSSKIFPSSGTFTVNLDVPSTFYFLNVQNNSSHTGTSDVYVNYGSSPVTTLGVNIPNNGTVYGLGYYSSISNEEIYITSSPTGYDWTFHTSLGGVNNQEFTCIMN